MQSSTISYCDLPVVLALTAFGLFTTMGAQGSSVPTLQIKPFAGMMKTLSVPDENGSIEVYRSDFTAHRLGSVVLKVRAIQDGELLDLAEVKVETIGGLSKDIDGTCYFALRTDKKKTTWKLLGCGIVTEGHSQSTPIRNFSVESSYHLDATAFSQKENNVAADDDQIVCGFLWRPSQVEKVGVKELLKQPRPFQSPRGRDIIEASKKFSDSIVVVITLEGKSD